MADFDDIVVGAGSSGATLAEALSVDGARRVLLLEAGPDYVGIENIPSDLRNVNTPALSHDWGYDAEIVPGRRMPYPRGRVTGGSSAINAAIALHPTPEDLRRWVALGNTEWDYGSVIGVLDQLERNSDGATPGGGQARQTPFQRAADPTLLRTHLAFMQACLSLGHRFAADHNDPVSSGVGPVPLNASGGLRVSTAFTSLEPARDRPNLTVRAGSLVDRVVMDGSRVAGVELVQGAGRELVTAGRVTLSAGSIGTPPILLRSGIGPSGELAELGIPVLADLPGVGRQLRDHAQIGFNMEAASGPIDTTLPWIQVLLRWTARGSPDRNDMQSVAFHLLAQPAIRLVTSLMATRSEGSVRILSRDPAQAPVIRLNLARHPEEIRRLAEGLRQLAAISSDAAFAPVQRGIAYLDDGSQVETAALAEHFSDDATAEAYIEQAVGHYLHPVGAARMGPADDPAAVVDQRCRVRGVHGLRVADASVMPAIPQVNTHLTCVAIGKRVARWMLNETSDQ